METFLTSRSLPNIALSDDVIIPVASFKTLSSSVHGSESSLSLRNITGPTTLASPPQTVSDYYTERDPLYLEPKRKSEDEIKTKNKKIQEFYRGQNDLIDELLSPIDKQLKSNLSKARIAVNGSLIVNAILFGLQLYAAISSGSLSLFATMADSFMDLLSNIILFITGRVAHGKNLIKYPTGMARMETAGTIVFSTLMSTLSIQLIIEAVKTLLSKSRDAEVHIFSIICISIAIVSKAILFIYCWNQRQFPSVQILAQDHRNDITINVFGLIMYILGAHIVWWVDPAGAILIAIIILRSWGVTAYEQINLIVGKSADTSFLQRATYIAMTHHPKVLQVDTCRAYHAGNNLFVEVDIVMDKNTPLWESHDIGESLQIKLEKLENVERAFVHVDYETSHKPEHQKEE